MKYKSDNYLVTHNKKLKKDSCFSIVKSEEISEDIFDSEVSLSNNKTYKQLFELDLLIPYFLLNLINPLKLL